MKPFVLSVIFVSTGAFAATLDRYIVIETPTENARVAPSKPISVSGIGKGLFEGNVVVRIEDMEGRELAQVATTMNREAIDAEGSWQTHITIPRRARAEIKLIAFSPSPKEGDAPITSEPVLLETTDPVLEGIYWRLHEYLGESSEMIPAIPETIVDAEFSDGHVAGSAGCNRYFGGYTTGPDNRLAFAPEIGSTQIACPPAVARQEQRYLNLLALVTTWRREDVSLRLFEEGGRLILRYADASLASLEDSRWVAAGINNGNGGVVSSESTHLATASFTGNEINGNAGCNSFSAAYEVDGNQVVIGPIVTTRKHCAEPEGIMDQEQQYLQALARAHTYILRPDRLELRDQNGSLQVSYRVQKL